ncbi:MAG: aldehyde dehydrogenase family protein, partial [Saprospiraceae bacterium]
EASIYDEFKTKLIAKVSKLIIGDPLNPQTQYGALISSDHKQKVLKYIELAKQEGGNILLGGNEIKMEGNCSNGNFVAPTIIENLGPDCRTNQEEIFGPVITLQSFANEEDSIRLANASEYGLAATLWTENIHRAHRVAAKINTGIVWVNCWLVRDLRTPFGGMNSSGVGREGGQEVLRFFTETKNVCIKYNETE